MPRTNRSQFEKRQANTDDNLQPRPDLKSTVNVSLCDYPSDNVQPHEYTSGRWQSRFRKYNTHNRVERACQECTRRKSKKTRARNRLLHSGNKSTEREGTDPSRVNHPEKPTQASDTTQYAYQHKALTREGLNQYNRRVLEQLAETEQAPEVGSEGSPPSIVMLPCAPLGPGGRPGDRTLMEDAVTEGTAMEAETDDEHVHRTNSAHLAAEVIVAGCNGGSTFPRSPQGGTQTSYSARDNMSTAILHSQPLNASSYSLSGSLPQPRFNLGSPDDPLPSELVKELSGKLWEWDVCSLYGVNHARIRSRAIIRLIIRHFHNSNTVSTQLADADESTRALGSESAMNSLQCTTCGSSPVPSRVSLPGSNTTTDELLADTDTDTDTNTDVDEVPEAGFGTESDISGRATHNTPVSDNAISVEEMNDLLLETARQESIRDHLEQIAAQELAAPLDVDVDLGTDTSAPPSRTDASPAQSRSPTPVQAKYNEHGVLTARSKGKGRVN